MDLSKIKDLKDLQAVCDLMQRNGLAELEVENEGLKLRLRKSEPRVAAERVVVAAPDPLASAGAGTSAPVANPAGGFVPVAAEVDDDAGLEVVASPLVGTFYRAPSPEADPFVQEGDRVQEDSLLCIVEAMKVMNEIRAGKAGIIRQILVKNGEPVEFGQPLFRLDPS